MVCSCPVPQHRPLCSCPLREISFGLLQPRFRDICRFDPVLFSRYIPVCSYPVFKISAVLIFICFQDIFRHVPGLFSRYLPFWSSSVLKIFRHVPGLFSRYLSSLFSSVLKTYSGLFLPCVQDICRFDLLLFSRHIPACSWSVFKISTVLVFFCSQDIPPCSWSVFKISIVFILFCSQDIFRSVPGLFSRWRDSGGGGGGGDSYHLEGIFAGHLHTSSCPVFKISAGLILFCSQDVFLPVPGLFSRYLLV